MGFFGKSVVCAEAEADARPKQASVTADTKVRLCMKSLLVL
jgi:hypothetical protein